MRRESRIPSAVIVSARDRRCSDQKSSLLVGLALAGALTLLPLVAGAQDQNASEQAIPVGVGILNATDYQPIGKGVGFDTLVQDPADPNGSALDNAVLERVNRELIAHGYQVDHDAPLVMQVNADLVRGSSKDAVVDKIKGIDGAQNDRQGNVFSTNGNTLLSRTKPDASPNTFRISLSIYDRKTGIYLWRGSMDRGTSNLTPDQATDRMVPPLVNTIGKAEQGRQVDIGATE